MDWYLYAELAGRWSENSAGNRLQAGTMSIRSHNRGAASRYTLRAERELQAPILLATTLAAALPAAPPPPPATSVLIPTAYKYLLLVMDNVDNYCDPTQPILRGDYAQATGTPASPYLEQTQVNYTHDQASQFGSHTIREELAGSSIPQGNMNDSLYLPAEPLPLPLPLPPMIVPSQPFFAPQTAVALPSQSMRAPSPVTRPTPAPVVPPIQSCNQSTLDPIVALEEAIDAKNKLVLFRLNHVHFHGLKGSDRMLSYPDLNLQGKMLDEYRNILQSGIPRRFVFNPEDWDTAFKSLGETGFHLFRMEELKIAAIQEINLPAMEKGLALYVRLYPLDTNIAYHASALQVPGTTNL
ncbi:unnamed protein product [Rhizoctonia solani]|uniref:Uncharacterized protein n=1 Tax=Rhizoctonia solani TaxID=456999 RepID=A0A8H2X1E0_9AGAM|nr:unnamed protein product [Rhizoctonia solani]